MHVQFSAVLVSLGGETKRNDDDDDYFYYYYREVAGWQQQCKLGSYFPSLFQLFLVIDPVVEAKRSSEK